MKQYQIVGDHPDGHLISHSIWSQKNQAIKALDHINKRTIPTSITWAKIPENPTAQQKLHIDNTHKTSFQVLEDFLKIVPEYLTVFTDAISDSRIGKSILPKDGGTVLTIITNEALRVLPEDERTADKAPNYERTPSLRGFALVINYLSRKMNEFNPMEREAEMEDFRKEGSWWNSDSGVWEVPIEDILQLTMGGIAQQNRIYHIYTTQGFLQKCPPGIPFRLIEIDVDDWSLV